MTNSQDESWQQAAERISRLWCDDKQFLLAIYRCAVQRVKQDITGGWQVRAPDRSWAEQRGDCSERALLMHAMVRHARPRLDIRIVNGYVPAAGIYHDTLEVHTGKYPWIIDQHALPGRKFVKMGEGLQDREQVVD